MNEIIQSLHDRKSVRAFEDRAVSNEVKEVLLEATLQAPTAGNQILYSIIDVTDASLKEKLAVTCDNQPFIKTAPLVFVFVADHTRWVKGFELAGANPRSQGVGDLMLAVTDTAIAAQNMVVAAQSLGLGSCYIGDILEQCETHRELLNLPIQAVPVCMLVLGYPTKQQEERVKPPRFDVKYVVGENTYPSLNDDEILECFREFREKSTPNSPISLEDYLSAFCNRKYNAAFSREMTRSVEKYLESFEKIEIFED